MSAGKIDWEKIHHRLEAIRKTIDADLSPAPEERDRILGSRAEALAREPEAEEKGEGVEIVEFHLAEERYGIESRHIREVYPLKDYTPLPGAPSFVLGLMNVRGKIISVIDIKKFFDLPEKGIGDLNKVIIIQSEAMEFGILADSILGVRTIGPAEIGPPLSTLTGIRLEFLRGVTAERTIILDAEKILADKRIIVDEKEF